ncbi:hypothetical protein V8G54_024365 [Vigna mungo]|uniref:Early nodulin-75-like n=1 Tax=Vigna mungo TaxID=3915 RepID=A0AAQ3RT50_VIGMU
MSPKNILVLLVAFVLVTSSLAILRPENNDAKPQLHAPKPPDHNKPSPHIENGHPKPPHHGKPPPNHGKPPPHMEDASYKDKPSHDDDIPLHIKDTLYNDRLPPDRSVKPPNGDPTHPDGKPPQKKPPHHGKPPPIGTTKELPPKEQQSTKNQHPTPGHGGHKVESTNFRPIDPPGSD